MTIIINETNARKELHIYDPSTRIDWVQDCLGNAGALHYDGSIDAYTMSAADYEWWVDYLSKHQADDNEQYALRQEYGIDAVDAIVADEMDGVNDYNDHHRALQAAFARIRVELAQEG